MKYDDFLKTKQFNHLDAGFLANELNKHLKDFQRDIVKWSLSLGRAAIFADTGLGKTLMQLSWAYAVQEYTDKPVLVLAPLCVAQQSVNEGKKFGIDATYIREPKFCNARIHITNYEMLKNFSPDEYGGIVLDESSILKGLNGKTRKMITEFASTIPYRLSCTATPSPNDFMELGTQSEFLGIMNQVEMLATFFIHDGSDTSKWRLKGHARKKFWEWLSTWGCVIRKPSDLGYESEGYDLPPLKMYEHVVETAPSDDLFVTIAEGLQERNKARRESVLERCKEASDITDEWDDNYIVWCNLNDESKTIANITGATEVTGSMKPCDKENVIMAFTDGDVDSIVTKPKIAGFGLNWQHCNKMVFVGLSDSFEAFYQAVRRCWRFGQDRPVEVHIVISDREGAVLGNIKRKQRQHDQMSAEMMNIMRDLTVKKIKGAKLEKTDYVPQEKMTMPEFIQ